MRRLQFSTKAKRSHPQVGPGANARGGLSSLVAIVMFALVSAAADPARADTAKSVTIEARRIPQFQSTNVTGNQFGRLEYLGGLQLTSDAKEFGGLSGLTIEPDGKRFLAVSDEGHWLAGEIAYQADRPIGIVNSRMGPIVALRGRTLDKKRDLDAEALSPLDGTLTRGYVLVGFERNHRIGIFPVAGGTLEAPIRYLKLPPEARRMKSNKGFEAVAALKGGPLKGSIIAFAERFPGEESRHTGWLWIKNQPSALTLVDHAGFDITDAASLSDGRLLVLERRFRWTEGVKMRLRLIAADQIKPGALLDGEILIAADLSSQIDNMEALAVHSDSAGNDILTMISDNNFNSILQRTLLLQFKLTGNPRQTGHQ